VRFARPLWLDLGGIAKGYAVDAALAELREAGCTEGLVNAGGDLAVFGPRAEPVALRCGGKAAAQAIPVLELADGAAASSATTGEAGTAAGAHFAGAGGARAPGGRFVTVAAPTCLAADALTKVVLARGAASSGLLARHGARAFLREADGTWLSLGATACEAAA
jgi:thiamine biosynthesis lipoprotein